MKLTRRMMKSIFGLFVLLLLCTALSPAGLSEKEKAQRLQKTDANDLYRPFLINNIFNYYGNNGDGSFNKFSTDNEGFEFYKGDGKHVIFEDGVVWGGFHKGRAIPKVGGSVYRHNLQAGNIIQNGTLTTDPVAAPSDDPRHRIYRVRPDINPNVEFSAVESKLNDEEVAFIGRYESYTARDIYDQYIKDWNEWPADLGAPYKDVDTNHVYNPATDIPGQPGSDQTLWYVANDMSPSRAIFLAGSPSIGVEMQRTIWGYRRAGALGNTIFMSTILINKSGAPIDTMYLVQWADPDQGNAGDDFVGCDTTRSLGFVYNGDSFDETYGAAAPAAGFDFFQGPLVAAPGDSAIFKLKRRYGFRNLPMSAFFFFTQGNPFYADPIQGTGGDIQWYRLMQGLVASSGTPFIDPTTNQPTKFTLSGDPTIAQDGSAGWVDGMGGLVPADRRLGLVTGPFTMAPGDTQELVVANLADVGADVLSSINVLKLTDDKAQSAYNSLFNLPAPPPSPVVKAALMDGQVILTWGDPVGVAKTEGTVDQGFAFEGYKVYELPGPSFTNQISLGTFDLVDGIKAISDTVRDAATGLNLIEVLQKGTDAGLIRSMTLNASKATSGPLINGTKYFFAVTAYSFNDNPPAAAGTHSLESPGQVITVIPQNPNPGTRYTSHPGDTVAVSLTTAAGGTPSDGHVVPIVVDPTRVTGDSYKVTFGTNPAGDATWSLTNTTKNVVLIANATNQTGDGDYAITDGLIVKVVGPPPGMKTWLIGGTRRFSPVGGALFGLEGFSSAGAPNAPQDRDNGTIGMAANFAFGSITTTLAPTGYHDVELRLAAVDNVALWDPNAAQTDVNFSHGYRYVRSAANPPAQPSFAPWITNPLGNAGYAYNGFGFGVPFSAWDLTTTPPTRLAVGHLENNQPNGLVDGRYWPGLTSVDNGDGAGPREFAFIFATPYSDTPDPQYTINFLGSHTPLMWVMTCARRADAPWVTGDLFTIVANHVNSSAHTFTFASAKPTVGDPTLAKADVSKINVFPNPYIGFNPQEINKYARFVTFNHLPKKATIRIFNLAGILIRTLSKDDAGQFFQWDLNNQAGFPVAAGMYIVHIDMSDLGITKTLKIGVIPEQQYLDRW